MSAFLAHTALTSCCFNHLKDVGFAFSSKYRFIPKLIQITAVTHNIPWFLREPATLLIGEKCYNVLVYDFDVTNVECLKYALSKGLGFGIVLGGSIVKIPQVGPSRTRSLTPDHEDRVDPLGQRSLLVGLRACSTLTPNHRSSKQPRTPFLWRTLHAHPSPSPPTARTSSSPFRTSSSP